jgi:hypothetical protein
MQGATWIEKKAADSFNAKHIIRDVGSRVSPSPRPTIPATLTSDLTRTLLVHACGYAMWVMTSPPSPIGAYPCQELAHIGQ